MKWRTITMLLLLCGCLHLASLAGLGRLPQPEVDKQSDPVPVMSSGPIEPTITAYRRFDAGGKRQLNSREGW